MGKTDANVMEERTKKIKLAAFIACSICEGAMFIYISMMPFVYKKYNIDTVTYGYIQSVYAFFQLCCSVLIGRAGDVFGARAIMLLATVTGTFAHLSMALARGMMFLIFSRMVSLFHDIMPGVQMLTTDITPPDDRGPALGKLGIPICIGMIVGPLLSGFLSSYVGEQGVFLCSWIAPATMALLILTQIPPNTKMLDKKDDGDQKKEGGLNMSEILKLCRRPTIPSLLFIKLLLNIPVMVYQMNMAIVAVTVFNMTPQTNGMMSAVTGILGVFVNAFALGYLSKTFGETTLIRASSVLMVFTWVFLSQVTSIPGLIVANVPFIVGFSVLENQVTTRLTKSVPESETGTVLGLGQSLFHLSRTVAPVAGTIMIAKYGFASFGYLGALVSIPLLFMTFSL